MTKKYLKSYKEYPAGTVIIGKNYSLWERFKHWVSHKRRSCNSIYIMDNPKKLTISKWSLLRDDFFLLVLNKPYTKSEISKMKTILKSCQSKDDYLTLINAIRPNTVDINKPLEQFKTNRNYKLFYLFSEPFQEITK